MSDDRLLSFLTARLFARENTATFIASVTSASSFVLLGILLDKNYETFEVIAIGLLFPSLGFIYNEITNRGIHKDDHKAIKDLILKGYEEAEKEKIRKILENKKYRRKRLLIVRFLLLSPILGWLLIVPISLHFSQDCKIIWDIVSIIGIVVIASWIAKSDPFK